MFITAGYSGKRFIFERSAELGVRTVIVDGPDSWSKELVDEGIAERFVAVDFSDAETVFERMLVALKKVRVSLGCVSRSCCFLCRLLVLSHPKKRGVSLTAHGLFTKTINNCNCGTRNHFYSVSVVVSLSDIWRDDANVIDRMLNQLT